MSQSTTREATSPGKQNQNVNPDDLSSEDKFHALGDTAPESEESSSNQPGEGTGEPAESDDNTDQSGGEPKNPEDSGEKEKKGGDKPPERFRLKGPEFEKERKFLELRKQGVDAEAAYKAAYGTKEGGETQENPFAEIDAEISQAEKEIQDLESKIEKATEDLDTAQALKLERERSRKEREIDKLQGKKESIKSEQKERELNAFEKKAVQYRDQAVEEFPELGERNSQERKEFNAFVEEKEADPDYADILKSPRWPLILAREFAQEHGLQKGGKKTAKKQTSEEKKPGESNKQPPKKPAESNPRKQSTAAKVLTSGEEPGEQSTFEATPEELENDLSNMSSEQKMKLLS